MGRFDPSMYVSVGVVCEASAPGVPVFVGRAGFDRKHHSTFTIQLRHNHTASTRSNNKVANTLDLIHQVCCSCSECQKHVRQRCDTAATTLLISTSQ
jgi:hypothetical protein